MGGRRCSGRLFRESEAGSFGRMTIDSTEHHLLRAVQGLMERGKAAQAESVADVLGADDEQEVARRLEELATRGLLVHGLGVGTYWTAASPGPDTFSRSYLLTDAGRDALTYWSEE